MARTAEWNPAPLNGQKITTKFRLKNAVDAVPVVHGRWVFGTANHREYMKCSECLHSYKPDGTFCYCPNCGAKMDMEE